MESTASQPMSSEQELGEIRVEWENIPRIRQLEADITAAKPYHDAQTALIDTWLDNLYIRNKALPKTGPNRSKVVPKVIRKQAEWRYASLGEPFLSNDDMFSGLPATFEDSKSAHQNALVLNHQFNNEMDKTKLIDEYIRTAVNEGTVVLRTGWEYQTEEYETEEPIVELTLDMQMQEVLAQAIQLRETNPNGYAKEVPYPLQVAVTEFENSGVPYRPEVVGMEVVTKERIKHNRPTVDIVEYQNFMIDPSCNGDVDKARFASYKFESSYAELKAAGIYHNLDRINLVNASPNSEPNFHSETAEGGFSFADKPRMKIVVTEYWGFYDVNNDGYLVSIVVSWCNGVVIRMEENPYPDKKIPFEIVSYLPVSRSVYGEPDGSLLEDNQAIIGAVTRGMIDIMGRSANGQIGIRRDMLDALNKRKFAKGDNYEFNTNTDPRQGFHMHTFSEIPVSAQFMLQQQNQDAEGLTGVKAFSGGLSGDELGSTATGVRGALDSSSQREVGILRRLANGLVRVGRKIVAMNGEFLSDTEVIRITNEQFIRVRRDELQGKFDLKLSVTTAEEDNARASGLEFMIQTVANSLDPMLSKELLVETARLRKMPDLAKRIEQYQPQPDPLDQQLKQLEIAKLQAEIAQLQSQTQENLAEAELDRAKAAQAHAATNQAALDLVEQESGTKQERELQKQRAQSEGNIALKQFERGLDREDKALERQQQQSDDALRNYLSSSRSSRSSTAELSTT